jgi:hypothetical protein
MNAVTSAFGTKRTRRPAQLMSALEGNADTQSGARIYACTCWSNSPASHRLLPHQRSSIPRMASHGALRPNTDFLNRINLIPPVQTPSEKYSASLPTQIISISPPSRSSRGALAIVTNVGAGCGGRGSVGRADAVAGRFSVSDPGARTNDVASVFTNASADVHMPLRPPGEDRSRTAKPCGPGTRCWC